MPNKRPTQNDPIRVVEGSTEPHARFWQWTPRNEAEAQDAEVQFYGYISEFSWWGDEITPKKFAEDLAEYGAGKPITVRINSGGGEIFAASAIRAMLADYSGKVTARIDGLCASAAVGVALAADEIKIQDTAYMMVHNPGYSVLFGWLDADALLELAAGLEKFTEGTLSAYQTRTGLDTETLKEMLRAETWMSASEAVELGFADTVINGGKPAAPNSSVENALSQYVNAPPALLNVSSADEPQADELKEQAERLQDKVSSILQKE